MNSRHPAEDEIFEQARQLSGEARAAYLKDAAGDDEQLRLRIDKLLQASEKAGDFLSQPAAESAGTFVITAGMVPVTEQPGDKIGRYKLMEKLGEGGCGIVYVAEQLEPIRRRVALKIIKLGMDTRHVVARFEAERQALALMDHPYIAKVLDAGATDTGRPYFVMELVRGIRITDYCDKNNLPTGERLKLFTQVCHAIQHAHQKGIIHRDIKPSNILVTLHDGVPVPKVIDFGIAKATTDQPLTDKTIYTAFEQFLGTPAYMSPEQAEMSGLDIDTRSDVYSLGVLLYELLTGNTPFDAARLLRAGLDQMRRVIREEEPLRPSTRLKTLVDVELTGVAGKRQAEPPKLIKLVRGDLDWIVMKCLEKDRTRRYETVNGLAADVGRYLQDEPVLARPPSRRYQLKKLVRRNRMAVGAGAAIVLVLAAGLAVTATLLVRERETRRRAVAAEKLQIRLRQEADLKRLARERADFENQGKLADAEQSYRKMLTIQTNLYGAASTNVIGTLTDLSYLLEHDKKYQEMEMAIRDAMAIEKSLWGEDSLALGKTLHRLGDALQFQGRWAEGEALHRQALALLRKHLDADNPELYWTVKNLAWALGAQRKTAEWEKYEREGLRLARLHGNGENLDVALSLYELGAGFNRQSRPAEAEPMLREALALRRKLLGNEHQQVTATISLLATVLRKQGKPAEAATLYREAAEKGNWWAQVWLARLYATGRGVPQNLEEAGKWHQKASEGGSANGLNAVAWELTTAKDASFRDGTSGVGFAERAVAMTGRTNSMFLDTLAAAHAETGRFDLAVRVQKEAMALPDSSDYLKEYAARLKLYEAGKPYRQGSEPEESE